MKRIQGMILSLAFSASMASAGSIGGVTTNGLIYNPNNQSIVVPDPLNERFVVARKGASPASDFKTYSLDARDFVRLQDLADSQTSIYVKSQDKTTTRSYYVQSGDELNQVELVDRLAKMRGCVAP